MVYIIDRMLTMSKHVRKKINTLLLEWQKGEIKTASYLNNNNYSAVLLNKYKKSHIISSIGKGAYKLYNDRVYWYSAINAIHFQLNKNLHLGSKTALNMFGITHFVEKDISTVVMYVKNDTVPKWFLKYKWKIDIQISYKNIFSKNYLKIINYKNYDIQVAVPEQAIMEMINDIIIKYTSKEIEQVFENLTMLRPKIIQDLLENCRSVKTKRVFLYFADKFNYKWNNKINRQKITLGYGKRQIVKNGRYIKKYNIVI